MYVSRYHLTHQELDDLEFEHCHATDKRYRKGGLTVDCIAEKRCGCGSDVALTKEQQQLLDQHLREHLYLTAKEIAHYVEQMWQVTYSESDMTQLLHQLGYVYKKPKLIPSKASADQQRDFVERYQKLKAEKAPDDPIYFMDATHPHHTPIAGYGWIKRGQYHEIRSNTGRQRINIIYDNAPATTALNLLDSRIELIFLPPYAPQPKLDRTLLAILQEKDSVWQRACDDFFTTPERHKEALRSLLTDNFQIID